MKFPKFKVKISPERKRQALIDEKLFKKPQPTTPAMIDRSWYYHISKKRWLLSWKTLKPIQRAVLLTLWLYAGRKNYCFPSTRRLAKDLELTQMTILQNLKKLEAKGFIKIDKKKGKYNSYILLK